MRKLTLWVVACVCVPVALAADCNSGSLLGTYGFVASRLPFVGMPVNPPGTTAFTLTGVPFLPPGTPGAQKVAPISSLVAGATDSAIFSAVGTIFADGNGGLFAASSASSPATTPVGTYSVGSDCSVSMTVSDGFSTAAKPPSVTFQGFIARRNNEVDLLQSKSSYPVPLTLQKTVLNNACTVANVSGNFGVIAMGQEFSTPAGGAANDIHANPVTLGAIFFADALGNFSTPAGTSTANALKGTYTVNPDCSGSATFTPSSGTSRHVNFVIVNSDGSGASQVNPPQLMFAVSDPRVVITGVAVPQ